MLLIVPPSLACTTNTGREDDELGGQVEAAQDSLSVPPADTYDAVVSGMRCIQAQAIPGQLECTYDVGRDLRITIAGVGDDAASIYIDKSIGMEGDYYASVGMNHQCIVVKPGDKTIARIADRGQLPMFAFISHRTGKVFRDWPTCSADIRR
jgi:hypothetical protein